MTVSKHYAELEESSIRIAGITEAPPDTLSYKSSGMFKRTNGQLSCPPSYCIPPATDLEKPSTSWCGWSASEGLDNYIDLPLNADNDGNTVSVNITKLTLADETHGAMSMLQIWANPTNLHGGFWDADVTLDDFSLANM